MDLPTYFTDFLQEIRPTSSQLEDMKTGHQTLRKRLRDHEDVQRIYVSDFLQGSYRRNTAVRPVGGDRPDVDIIVVTNLSKEDYRPIQAMRQFEPFLDEYYAGKYEYKGRAIGIELTYVDLDLVVTAAPSEAEQALLRDQLILGTAEEDDLATLADRWTELLRKGDDWKLEPLDIPNREADEWEETHPLAQIQWTTTKNARCNGHYVNVVKAIKWWRIEQDATPKRPKSYPLEHIIGQCCPDDVQSVGEGVTLTFEAIRDRFKSEARAGTTPILRDHGVDRNVLERISGDDFAQFHVCVTDAARIARQALDAESIKESADLWRMLFGDRFPPAPDDGEGGDDDRPGGFTSRKGGPSKVKGERFA